MIQGANSQHDEANLALYQQYKKRMALSTVRAHLKAGQTVLFKHSALSGLEGIVQSVSSKRVAVLLEILGRPTLVKVEHHQVESVV